MRSKQLDLTFAWASIGVNTSKTTRAILIVIELKLSATFVQIFWLANQNSFLLF